MSLFKLFPKFYQMKIACFLHIYMFLVKLNIESYSDNLLNTLKSVFDTLYVLVQCSYNVHISLLTQKVLYQCFIKHEILGNILYFGWPQPKQHYARGVIISGDLKINVVLLRENLGVFKISILLQGITSLKFHVILFFFSRSIRIFQEVLRIFRALLIFFTQYKICILCNMYSFIF